MKEERDILKEAVNQIKGQAIPPGPPKELADATVSKLTEAAVRTPEHEYQHRGLLDRLTTTRSLPRLTFRFATAAVLVLLVGFAAGRLSGPTQPDVEQLYIKLEPALRASVEKALYERVSDEIDQRWRLALQETCLALKDNLTRQYREDLSQFATQMLVASNTETNRRLDNLAQSLDEAKARDMRQISQALHQLDQERLQDRNLFEEYIRSLADQTGSEFERIRRQMYSPISNSNVTYPDNTENQDTLDN